MSKPFVGPVIPNPEYAPRAPVERNEADEVDVKPFVGAVNLNPEYAPFTSARSEEQHV